MEAIECCLDILKVDPRFENEGRFIEALTRFCDENSSTFAFQHVDLSLRKEFINALLEELNSCEIKHSVQFNIKSLSALRILSRDKDSLGILTTERSCVTLLVLSGLYTGLCTTAQDHSNVEKIDRRKDAQQLKFCCATTSKGIVEIMDLPSIVANHSVVAEALKCLCNLVFQSSSAREVCAKYNCTSAVLTRQHKWFDCEDLPKEVKLFDLRLLFLLTALDSSERSKVVSNGGLCVLTNALDTCVPGKLERIRSQKASDKDGCGQEEKGTLKGMSVVQRTAIEAKPKTYSITEDQISLAAEILKTLFNVTLSESPASTDTDKHYQMLVLISRSILVHIMPTLPTPSEHLCNHALNILNNVPQQWLPYLLWTVPKTVGKKLCDDYEALGINGEFRPVYEDNNTYALKSILELLDKKMKQADVSVKENLMPVLSALYKLAWEDRIIRKYLRSEIFPPLGHVGHSRPEEGNGMRNQLIQLMTAPLGEVKDLVANFLFVLCKENVDRLVKYTGFGNAAGFLASRGLMAGGQGSEGQYSSDDDSDTEEYASVKGQIDPVIGAIPKNDGEANPLASMTEEEKEEEAEKLAGLIRELSGLGIIKPLQVGSDGRLQECASLMQKDTDNDDSTN